MRWALGIAAVAAAVLGYGAWHAHTHADVWLGVHDLAQATASRRWADVQQARLVLRDAQGRALAEAELAPPHGLPRYTGPAGAAVDCSGREGPAWRDCWAAQSRWFAGWAPRVATLDVTVGACVIETVPVERATSADWWLWWVPLPHVGGTPLAVHRFSASIDSANCRAGSVPAGRVQ